MTSVLVLGGTGMLGHAVLSEFQEFPGEVRFTSRNGSGISFDVLNDPIEVLSEQVFEGDFIINCFGVTKPHINDSMESDRIKASLVNSAFPKDLAKIAEKKDARVLQIATDCVFSGNRGHYLETDPHDAIDVYGKTKSIGEAESESVMHVRVSIIGRELNRSTHLLEWVLSQAPNAVIPGYVDHFWNGVTTKHFAKMAHGIITNDTFKPGVSHLVPANELSKAELVREIATTFGRLDLTVEDTESGHPTNRTLGTANPLFNQLLWEVAGYREIPTIHQLVSELTN